MSALAQRLLERYYPGAPHPYRLFEQRVDGLVAGGAKAHALRFLRGWIMVTLVKPAA